MNYTASATTFVVEFLGLAALLGVMVFAWVAFVP